MEKFLSVVSIVIVVILFFFAAPNTANAASLINVSDQLSTSRPSPASTLTADQAGSALSFTLYDNGSYFLASDSARFIPDTGETQSTITVASMSASVASVRTIYVGAPPSGVSNPHHNGDTVVAPVTAVHKVQFTTSTAVPGGGNVVITFPGGGSNSASPSASTFSFNGLSSSNITVTGATCASWTISAPSITCVLNGSGIGGSTTVAFYIGCTGITSGACSTSVPTLINPTSSITQVSGGTSTADTWQLTVATQNSGGASLDTASVRVATIQSIQVQATVEPTITFTISGVNNGTTINSLNSNCTGNTDVTNTGIGTTSTFVNLGVLSNGLINLAAQTLTVSTNASSGYSVVATSSGHLINPSNGFYLQDNGGATGLSAVDTPVPSTFPASGNTWFGIHACGTNATAQWATGPTGFSSGAKYANPWNSGANSFYDNLTVYSGGPVNSDVTTVEYGATVGGATPAGLYSTALTYIATAIF